MALCAPFLAICGPDFTVLLATFAALLLFRHLGSNLCHCASIFCKGHAFVTPNCTANFKVTLATTGRQCRTDRTEWFSSCFYLTTIGVFSVGAEGAIEKTNHVFQPDDRF